MGFELPTSAVRRHQQTLALSWDAAPEHRAYEAAIAPRRGYAPRDH